MTAKTDAMRALIEAVKAGHESTALIRAMPDYTSFEQVSWIYSAATGSLDAAKALHDALLPDMPCAVYFGYEYGATVTFSPTWDDGRISASNTIPARAWLIAILEALIEKETG